MFTINKMKGMDLKQNIQVNTKISQEYKQV